MPIEDKYDGIHPYKYSIAIENYQCNDYWTEKITDCFLSRTMPIYWGASNISKYFPEKSMIRIDPSDPGSALRKINDALDADLYSKNFDYIEEARELILEKYQFFPHMEYLLKKYPPESQKKFYFLPANRSG
jgi:Glycosyltransferase family 10 (fucosyltransferase).